MIFNNNQQDYTFGMFEKDMVEVLKDMPDNRIELDGKLLYESRRFGCLLRVRDLHINGSTGQVVMVGSHVAGRMPGESSWGMVDVPLYECYPEMKAAGCHLRLVNKARKAAIASLIDGPFMYAARHGMTVDGGDGMQVLDFSSLGYSPVPWGQSAVDRVGRRTDGGYVLFGKDPDFPDGRSVSTFSFGFMKRVGDAISTCNANYCRASEVYVRRMRELMPVDMSYTAADYDECVRKSFMAVGEAGFSDMILRSVRRMHTSGWDLPKELREAEKRRSGNFLRR